MNQLKDIVKYHRIQAGLSRKALSELAGVSTTFLSDLEFGKETMQFDKLKEVLKTLNIKIVFDSPIMNELNHAKG